MFEAERELLNTFMGNRREASWWFLVGRFQSDSKLLLADTDYASELGY